MLLILNIVVIVISIIWIGNVIESVVIFDGLMLYDMKIVLIILYIFIINMLINVGIDNFVMSEGMLFLFNCLFCFFI